MLRSNLITSICCFAVAHAALGQQVARADTLYVDNDATAGQNNGSSWQNAYLKLSDAIANARNTDFTSEIRVAAGTYTPGTARADAIQLTNDVTILGGFRGLQPGGSPDDRNIACFETVLSGDIGTPGDDSDNSYHVVYSGADNITGILDGFTITKGNDNRGNPWGHGGVFLQDGNATLRNCVIFQNFASTEGGGIFCTYCDATLINCQILGNYAPSEGGGLWAGGSNINLINCIFNGNRGQHGAGLMIKSNSTATITNCTITYNTATGIAGAIYNEGTDNCTIANSIIWGNSASSTPDQLYGDMAATYCRLPSVTPGEGNIIADPLFIDPDGSDNTHGTIDDNLRLQLHSPCANTANEDLLPPEIIHDYEGDDRIQDCALDMGADESPHWTTDCNTNSIDDACEIATGTSFDCNTNAIPDDCDAHGLDDCNNNGQPDFCEAADGIRPDCNNNFIPDECEPGYLEDCNNNSVPDLCDIAGATATDCNLNAIPDECDIQFGTSTDCQPDEIPDECQLTKHGTLTIEISTGFLEANVRWELICQDQLIASDEHLPSNSEIVTEVDIPTGALCEFIIHDSSCSLETEVRFDVTYNGIPICSGNGFGRQKSCFLSTMNDCNNNGVPDDCDIATGTSVSADGDMTPDECQPILNITKNSRHFTINEAVNASSNGDEVLVEPGTYNELIYMRRKAITLRSTNGPDDTIIDGNGGGPIMYELSKTGPTVIDGFTFTGGHAEQGGAMRVMFVPHLQLTNCLFNNNTAEFDGGALYTLDAVVDISKCRFLDNSTSSFYNDYGGAMYCDNSNATLADCVFERNTTTTKGGGLHGSASTVTLRRCEFTNNSISSSGDCSGGGVSVSDGQLTLLQCHFIKNSLNITGHTANGGGVAAEDSDLIAANCLFLGNSATYPESTGVACGGGAYCNAYCNLTNCVFNGNTASSYGGGLYLSSYCPTRLIRNCTVANNSAGNDGGGIWANTAIGTLTHSIIWGNSAPQYPQLNVPHYPNITHCCTQPWFDDAGNIVADPMFVDADGPDGIPGTIDDDLRLMPTVSPCIDAGSNGLLPADEFDLDNDGITDEPIPVDFYDNPRISDDTTRPDTGIGISPIVDIGAYEVHLTSTPIGDLDLDGDVDLYDFMIFQEQFTGPQSAPR